jgi:hypothetical protein
MTAPASTRSASRSFSSLDHLVNLAELTVLAWGTYLLLLAATAIFGAAFRRGTTARALLREIRASFYRKLLLAFIAATVVPVAALGRLRRAATSPTRCVPT